MVKSDLSGTTLGPYRVLDRIGHGGMSMVYKAYQSGTDRLVALKILPDLLAQDPMLVERFKQEARVVARLEHRHIVPIYDFGEYAGVTYLAMRYLQAGTVKDILARGRLSLPEALPMMAQVAGALDYAHEQGIIHRDVKPGNILVDKHGDAYLTDFGLAKLLTASGEFTRSGSLVGTPAYMAPEQTLGQPVSPATDVYSLGVMIYEIATGRLPFVSDTPMAIALMHLKATLPLPRSLNPALSESVEEIILKALDKDPQLRYPTAGDLTQALASAIAADTQPVAPAPQLVEIAGEIAGQKGPEEISSGLRTQINRQVKAEQRHKLMRWAPWAGGAVLIAGLALALLLALNQTAQARFVVGQTATAIMVLYGQLDGAQTAVAQGRTGDLPTVEFLQTQVARALTAEVSLGSIKVITPTATVSPTASGTATPTSTPTPTSTQTATQLPVTPTLFRPTTSVQLPAPTNTLIALEATVSPPPNTPFETPVAPTATPQPPTATLVPSNTPNPTDMATVTSAPPTDTLQPSTATPAPSDTAAPTDTQLAATDTSLPPTDTVPPPTDTPVPTNTPAATDPPTDTLQPSTDTIVPSDTPAPTNSSAPPTDTVQPPTDTPGAALTVVNFVTILLAS